MPLSTLRPTTTHAGPDRMSLGTALPALTSPHRGRGFTLIEVMVAVFVLSLGLLSVGALQLISKQSNFEAIQRTTATLLAQDIIERMRANPHALGAYVSYSAAGTTVGGGTRSTPAVNCDTSACDADALAAYDLWRWEQLVDGATEQAAGVDAGGVLLPIGCIMGPADGSAGTYTITLAWQGKAELSDDAKSSNTCGAGRYGANDEFRRLLSITTYIADE